MKGPLEYSELGMEAGIACPLCGFACTHIDRVEIAARAEDRPPTHITVNAVSGIIQTRADAPPVGPTVGEGRRHRIALIGECENGCHPFAIVFTQHKGDTLVEVVRIVT